MRPGGSARSDHQELRPSHEQLRSILYRALREPVGLLLASSDPERARKALQNVKRELEGEGAAELSCLQFRLTVDFPDEGSLLIVKGEPKRANGAQKGRPRRE